MLMTILRPLFGASRRIAAPAAASIMITFYSFGALAADRPGSFADQVEMLSPAVVNISTTTIVNQGPGMDMPQFPPGSPFEEFFKNFGDGLQILTTF